MKKVISLVFVSILILSGLGAGAFSIKNTSIKQFLTDEFDMIIITPTNLSDYLIPLLEHKNQHMIFTKIVKLEEIFNSTYFPIEGRDNAEKIKYFIKNSIENWNIKYVLLVGGKEEMPARYIHISSPSGPSHFISDLYYSDIYDENMSFCSWDSNENSVFGEMDDENIIDSVDLNPDICIGRILCKTGTEVSIVVNKIIDYESTDISSKTWFKNMILCGGDEQPYIILEFLLPLILKRIGRVAFEGEFMSKQIQLLLNDFNSKKIFTSKNIGNDALGFTIENINNAINDGAGFLVFNTHGHTDRIVTHPPFNKNVWLPSLSGYSTSDVINLTNGEKLPIAVFNACLCGDFESSMSPLAWEFIKHNDGGSIASIACTTVSDMLPGTLCVESLLGYLTKEFFLKYSEGNQILGEIWKESIRSYLNNEEALRLGAPDITIGRLTLIETPCFLNHFVMEEWILLGDPSLKIGGYS